MIAGATASRCRRRGGAGRRLSRVVSAALAVAAVSTGVPSGAHAAVITGVSDQRATFFDSPAYRALEINDVRLVVPWDAGTREGPWNGWIARALRDGARVQVALEHGPGSRCPDSPCPLPSTAAYGDALAALLATYPAIREITPWNEPNHNSQPTFRNPSAAAAYYEEARVRCAGCTIVAGDLLDDGALFGYLSAYKAALTSTPRVWGVHNYFDATYFQSRGVETMLRETSGALWLNETGGIISFTPGTGGGLPYDEQRAADSVRWLYDLVDRRPAVERMYLYQWQGARDNGFDSGLLGYDGTPRPSYSVVAARVGSRGGIPPSPGAAGALAAPGAPDDATGSRAVVLAAPGTHAALRPGRRLRFFVDGHLEVRARCVARRQAATRCRQRLAVRVAGTVVTHLRVDVAVRRTFKRVVRLPRWATRRLLRSRSPRVQLQTCAIDGHPCGGRVTARVALSAPTRRRTAGVRAGRTPQSE
jgi:hypothetical protein